MFDLRYGQIYVFGYPVGMRQLRFGLVLVGFLGIGACSSESEGRESTDANSGATGSDAGATPTSDPGAVPPAVVPSATGTPVSLPGGVEPEPANTEAQPADTSTPPVVEPVPTSTGDGVGTLPPEPECTAGVGVVDVGVDAFTDNATCLTWQKTPSTENYTNLAALTFCEGLSQDGLDDWRVPAPEELATYPNLPLQAANAYITSPTYIEKVSQQTVEARCRTNAHSCNLTQYNLGSLDCAWQGGGFVGPLICVSGAAVEGSTTNAFNAASCGVCAPQVTSSFELADCSPFAN